MPGHSDTVRTRDEAVRSLQQYVSETLKYIDAVQKFSGGQTLSDWRLVRMAEISTLKKIRKSTTGGQRKLDKVLKNTLEGIEKLTDFLEAVEKLAVTSVHVFTAGEEFVKPSLEISPQSIEEIISAARLVCPLLLQFKIGTGLFFQPSLHNVAIFVAELEKYINTTEKICEAMKKSSAIVLEKRRVKGPLVQYAGDFTSDDMQNIICQVNDLSEMRKDQNFRLVFLFQEKTITGFVNQFTECQPRMLQFLDDMEGRAIELDRMKKGSKISSVAGSSVGIVGGILSIVGLALAPVTAGVSLGLTIGGLGMSITTVLNSAVTTITEISVNKVQQKRAGEDFKKFMEDVNCIQACLDEVIHQREETLAGVCFHLPTGAVRVCSGAIKIGKGARKIQKIRLAAELPEIGQGAARGTVALSKSARALGIGLNVLFIGLDIYFICTDSISLYKGVQSEFSEVIRARAALLRFEVDSWKRIHDSLCIGVKTLEHRRHVLQEAL